MYSVFTDCANEENALNVEQFHVALGLLAEKGMNDIGNTPYAERLFTLLDKNGDGAVDVSEFIAGLGMLCTGDAEEKIKISFMAFDIDGDGFISRSELEQMFTSAWLAGFSALQNSDMEECRLTNLEIHDFCIDCAKTLAEKVIDAVDQNNDGKLSEEEFKVFAEQNIKITAALNNFEEHVALMFQ
eukprot:TRINITY_DN104863_c0_g1_i2.p1 TRINITY_DN104863_c0_g1~~TRINITY_DN104863_c0_g1_i2.p1  ORF type:complete len:186 (+),score=57.07 TRINITY_DN104863_c0_g1_i2:154-711(+)